MNLIAICLQLVRARKPTGNSVLPWDVKEAHGLQKLIDTCAGLRTIEDLHSSSNKDMSNNNVDGDSDLNIEANDDAPEHISVSSDEPNDQIPAEDPSARPIPVKIEGAVEPKLTDTKTPVRIVRTVHPDLTKTAHKRASSLSGASNILKTITESLNHNAQLTRDRNRGQQQLQGLQLLTLTQQLRDANAMIESLHRESVGLQDRLNKSECQREHAKICLEMLQWRQDPQLPQRDLSGRRIYECRIRYPDEGEARYFVRSDEEDNLFVDNVQAYSSPCA